MMLQALCVVTLGAILVYAAFLPRIRELEFTRFLMVLALTMTPFAFLTANIITRLGWV